MLLWLRIEGDPPMRNLSFVFVLTACAGDPTPQIGDDELAGEDNDGEEAKADGVDTFGLLTAQKIGTFECNGQGSCTHVALARANRTTTLCADNALQASCDVRYLDFSKLGLTATALDAIDKKLQASAATPGLGPQLIVRGKYVHGTNPVYPDVDWVTFEVSQVWTAQIGASNLDGTFVELTDNGTRCITQPCATDRETRLNSTRFIDINGLDWSDALAASTLPSRVRTAIADGTGAIVVGYRTTDTLASQTISLRSVNEVFLRMK
jgi:hypothetical protein